jgi:hypothetical protein
MSLPPSFAESGLHIHRPHSSTITHYQVLGERSSGTNFVKRLVGRNSALTPSEALGWKHGFPHMMAIPHNMAVVCVVRRADTWAASMFSKPWHTTQAMQSLPFSEFIRAEWETIIDRPRYFGDLVAKDSVGAALQHDRDPATGKRFGNIFALRQAKLTGLLSLLNRDCACVFVRMESAQAAPEATLDGIVSGLGAGQPSTPFRPVVKRLGSKFKPAIDGRPALPEAWTDKDTTFLRHHIDPDQENALGYSYDAAP